MKAITWGIRALAAGTLVVLAGCTSAAQPTTPTTTTSSTTTATTTATTTTTAAPTTAGSTTYTVDAGASTAAYAVHEKFLDKNMDNTAVGKTSAFTGDLVLAGGKIMPSTVTVDLRSLKSDSGRRDNFIQSHSLETAQYPDAAFTITGVEGTAPAFTSGQEVALKLAGTMKMHGTEQPMVFDAKASLQGDTFHLTGVANFKMSDFGIKPPNILNLISVTEDVQLNVDVTAKKK